MKRKYVMTFELYNTTYLSAASKLKDKGHFQRAEDIQNHVGWGTQNKFDIFHINMESKMAGHLTIDVFFGNNRKITIYSDPDPKLIHVTGDKFSSRKTARRFLRELLNNEEFNEGLLHHDMPEVKNTLSVNDFYNER